MRVFYTLRRNERMSTLFRDGVSIDKFHFKNLGIKQRYTRVLTYCLRINRVLIQEHRTERYIVDFCESFAAGDGIIINDLNVSFLTIRISFET